ncbi:trypsin-3-like [Culicoides brevitarsis]|uniref:trypsin-3-like n=1 Tax=Culicoides brevitarsis TaxID=469753 RepID=UPI00307BFABF
MKSFLILVFFVAPAIFCQDVIDNNVEDSTDTDFDKIVGGYNANIAEFSYQASIQQFLRGSFKHFCGGSIITPSYILSAAHCFEGKTNQNFALRAGSNHTNRAGQFRMINFVKVHPNYDPKSNDFDVAVLKVRYPLRLNNFVSTIALPPFGEEVNQNMTGIISGWGLTSYNGLVASTLQTVKVPIVKWGVCKTVYPDLTNNMFCAGNIRDGGVDSCQGDSGGPFVQNVLNGKVLTGIVSWGYQCATRGYPGVYSKVSVFRTWIDSVIA